MESLNDLRKFLNIVEDRYHTEVYPIVKEGFDRRHNEKYHAILPRITSIAKNLKDYRDANTGKIRVISDVPNGRAVNMLHEQLPIIHWSTSLYVKYLLNVGNKIYDEKTYHLVLNEYMQIDEKLRKILTAQEQIASKDSKLLSSDYLLFVNGFEMQIQAALMKALPKTFLTYDVNEKNANQYLENEKLVTIFQNILSPEALLEECLSKRLDYKTYMYLAQGYLSLANHYQRKIENIVTMTVEDVKKTYLSWIQADPDFTVYEDHKRNF